MNRINHTTPLTIATLLMSVLLTSCATNSKAPEDTPVELKVPLLVPDAPEVMGMNPRNLIPPVALPESAEERFDVVANKVPAAAFFNSLVDGSGFNLVVHPEVKGNISLNLKNVTVREALSAVRDLYGYDFTESGYGIQILPKSLQTRIFPINYLNVVRKGRSGMKVSNGMNNEEDTEAKNVFGEYSGSQGNSTEVETLTSSGFWGDLDKTLSMMIKHETEGSVVVDANAGLVIVRAMPGSLRQIQKYLEAAELTVQKQVLIEAKIVEVTLNDGAQSGIDWSTLAARTGKNDVWAVQGSEPLSDPNLLGGIFTLNVDAGDFTGALSLLETQGDLEVL